jgi:hypothetical protein
MWTGGGIGREVLGTRKRCKAVSRIQASDRQRGPLGETASLLTFFPGFVFAWLFLRRRSLLPPVLLHGAANIGYVLLFASPV